jgi:hypothetical protein
MASSRDGDFGKFRKDPWDALYGLGFRLFAMDFGN